MCGSDCVLRFPYFRAGLNRKELSFGRISISKMSKIHFAKASFNNVTLKVMVMVHLFQNHVVVSNNQPPAPKNHSPTDTRTPLKFNMEPENQPMEKETPIGKPSFSGSMLSFWG